MMHFFPDGDGGFFGYDDPVLDFEGGAILTIIAAVSITAIVVPFGTNPELFADGIACALLGFILIGLSAGEGGLPFLRPLALPLFVYFLASSSFALEAISGEFGLLMWPILGFYLIFAGLGLYGVLLGGEEVEGAIVLFTLGFGAPIWFTCITAGMDDYQNWLYGTFSFYLLRVATIIGLVWAAIVLVMWFIAIFKGQISFNAIVIRLAQIALGVVPVFLGGILGGFFPNGPLSLAGLAAILAVFALAGWASELIASDKDADADIFPVVTFLAFVGAIGFLTYANFRANAEFLVFLRPFANWSFLVNEMFAASQVAANAVGAVCSGIVWVFTRIFDLSSVTIEAPTHIGFFVLLILSAVAVGVGQSFARKQASSTK